MKNIAKNLLTQTEREELISLISQIENILDGKLASLTKDERRYFGSIKEKNKLLRQSGARLPSRRAVNVFARY